MLWLIERRLEPPFLLFSACPLDDGEWRSIYRTLRGHRRIQSLILIDHWDSFGSVSISFFLSFDLSSSLIAAKRFAQKFSAEGFKIITT